MSFSNHQPPRMPLRFLRFFMREKYLEEIEGDMEELFHEYTEQFSLKQARRKYTWEIIKLVRPILLKQLPHNYMLSHFTLFGNYSKTSLRSLMKNPLTSFINVFGLSFAIGICILVYSFLEYDASIDQFHKNKHEVFLATSFAERDGALHQYGITPRPLGEMLKTDFTQIKKVCRIEDAHVVVKQADQVFHERVRYADASFLEMFTFPLKWGTPGSLADVNSIILSEDMAIKYFGEENPVGSELLLIFDNQQKKSFLVTGVAAPFPKAHDIEFSFLVNFENTRVADSTYRTSDWTKYVSATLIQVNNATEAKAIEGGMGKYKALQNEALQERPITSFALEPLSTLFEKSGNIKECISHDGNLEGRIGMPVIAIFMLALACFNYINIAIVSAAKRLKEIGVRKVIGASKTKVVVQFLTENIVVTSFALLIGLLLGMFIITPWFTAFTGWPLEVNLWNSKLWIFLVGLLFLTGLTSGIYPAFYISRFEALRIFKGSLEFGRKNPLTKVFLGIQLILACITISASVVFIQNNEYQRSRSWGYNPNHALYVPVPDQAAFEKLKASMEQHPNVLAIAGSVDHLGRGVSHALLQLPPNRQYEVAQLAVDAQYMETMQLTLNQGRSFHNHPGSDRSAIIVNSLLVDNLGITEPIGYQLTIESVKYEIVGVLDDFHDQSFFVKMEPTIFKMADAKDYRYLTLRVKEGTDQQTFATLQQQWAKLYPEIPFQGGYQHDVWSGYFNSLDKSVAFNTIIACVAVLLASLGLYGLVTLNVSGRVREFSIRKTLGASLRNLTTVILAQYTWLTVIALAIGAPISYVFVKAYLDMLFSYSMPMGYSGIAMAVVLLLLVLFAVVSTQITRVAKGNPVDGLKVE